MAFVYVGSWLFYIVEINLRVNCETIAKTKKWQIGGRYSDGSK